MRRSPVRCRWASGLCLTLLCSSACLFAPRLEENGYTLCENDADCEPGRDCDVGICGPPPWFDEAYAQRRLLVVDNPSTEAPLAAGSAVPVRIGEGGLFPVEELGADARFVTYDRSNDSGENPGEGWSEVPAFRVLELESLTQWMRVPTEVPPGGSAVLSWMHRERADGEILVMLDALAVFDRYDDFTDVGINPVPELNPTRYRVDGTGDATVEEGRVVLRDNTQLFALERLEPPFVLTATGRINGLLCDALFIGLQGDDFVGSVPPYVGFFFQQQLDVALDVVPTAASQPGPLDFLQLDAPTALHRYTIEVNAGRVRLSVDEQVLAERTDLVPPMADDELVFTVDVDGDCTFDLESIWVTHLPFDGPDVRVMNPVRFAAFD